jgi:hypothetical protein
VDFDAQFPYHDHRTILELLEMDNPNQKTASIMDDDFELHDTPLKDGKNAVNAIPPFKFHLSMISDWHFQKGSKHDNDLNEAALEMWLPQCLGYIKEQLEYVLGRMGK